MSEVLLTGSLEHWLSRPLIRLKPNVYAGSSLTCSLVHCFFTLLKEEEEEEKNTRGRESKRFFVHKCTREAPNPVFMRVIARFECCTAVRKCATKRTDKSAACGLKEVAHG